jgi:hypothetical protein
MPGAAEVSWFIEAVAAVVFWQLPLEDAQRSTELDEPLAPTKLTPVAESG